MRTLRQWTYSVIPQRLGNIWDSSAWRSSSGQQSNSAVPSSAQQKGLFVQSPVSYSLLPLETISSKASDILSAFKEDVQKKTESSSAGRRDQYNVQLNRLKYGRPGVEVLLFPKAITRPGLFTVISLQHSTKPRYNAFSSSCRRQEVPHDTCCQLPRGLQWHSRKSSVI